MNIPEIILASGSPRRAELLKRIGLQFRVMTGNVSEELKGVDDPRERVILLSERKAEAVIGEVKDGLVIGADTVVVLDDEIFGKPADPDDAVRMLMRLSGKTHDVYTGFTLIQTDGKRISDVERTAVTFRKIEPWEIIAYVETGNPMDKAGAYGIQDQSSFFVERIEGCFYNVVGFPIARFYRRLKDIWDDDMISNLFFRGERGSERAR